MPKELCIHCDRPATKACPGCKEPVCKSHALSQWHQPPYPGPTACAWLMQLRLTGEAPLKNGFVAVAENREKN